MNSLVYMVVKKVRAHVKSADKNLYTMAADNDYPKREKIAICGFGANFSFSCDYA